MMINGTKQCIFVSQGGLWRHLRLCCAVVFTIGPACQDVDTLCNILDAGATCARCDLTVRFCPPVSTLQSILCMHIDLQLMM